MNENKTEMDKMKESQEEFKELVFNTLTTFEKYEDKLYTVLKYIKDINLLTDKFIIKYGYKNSISYFISMRNFKPWVRTFELASIHAPFNTIPIKYQKTLIIKISDFTDVYADKNFVNLINFYENMPENYLIGELKGMDFYLKHIFENMCKFDFISEDLHYLRSYFED